MVVLDSGNYSLHKCALSSGGCCEKYGICAGKGNCHCDTNEKEWVRAGNRSFESLTYIVWIEYPIEGYNYLEEISERYSFDMFSEGDKVPVLYCKDATSKAYVARKDWMTGAYLPVDKYYNVPVIIAAILLGIGFLLYTNSPLLKSER